MERVLEIPNVEMLPEIETLAMDLYAELVIEKRGREKIESFLRLEYNTPTPRDFLKW